MNVTQSSPWESLSQNIQTLKKNKTKQKENHTSTAVCSKVERTKLRDRGILGVYLRVCLCVCVTYRHEERQFPVTFNKIISED